MRAAVVGTVLCLALFGVAACGDDDDDGGGGGSASQGFKVPDIPMQKTLGAGEGKLSIIDAVAKPEGAPVTSGICEIWKAAPIDFHYDNYCGNWILLEGEITFTAGEQRVVASAGTFVSIPMGLPHSFKNESGRAARMLIEVAPAGLEEMFFEVGTPLDAGATSAPPPSREEIEKLLRVAPKYGVEILPPKH